MPYNSLQCGMIKLGDITQSVAKEDKKWRERKLLIGMFGKSVFGF